jgi:hypothetical protein
MHVSCRVPLVLYLRLFQVGALIMVLYCTGTKKLPTNSIAESQCEILTGIRSVLSEWADRHDS